jgi:hypothetical protein
VFVALRTLLLSAVLVPNVAFGDAKPKPDTWPSLTESIEATDVRLDAAFKWFITAVNARFAGKGGSGTAMANSSEAIDKLLKQRADLVARREKTTPPSPPTPGSGVAKAERPLDDADARMFAVYAKLFAKHNAAKTDDEFKATFADLADARTARVAAAAKLKAERAKRKR